MFAVAGVALAIREVRRKERRDALKVISHMEHVILDQQNEAIAWRAYVYELRRILADHGLLAPDPPALAEYTDVESSTLLRDEHAAGRRNNRAGRGRRRRRLAADDGVDPGAEG